MTLLRDLSRLSKTGFDINVNLLVSSLQVDLDNSLKAATAKYLKSTGMPAAASEQHAPEEAVETGDTGDSVRSKSQRHPVATLVPGCDALQSALLSNQPTNLL